MENTVNQKVKIRDIFSSLKDIFSGSKSNKNEEIVNQKLEAIYKVQSELGVTDSIAKLEKDIKTHIFSEKVGKTKNSTKVSTRVVTSEIENTIQESSLNQDNSLDR